MKIWLFIFGLILLSGCSGGTNGFEKEYGVYCINQENDDIVNIPCISDSDCNLNSFSVYCENYILTNNCTKEFYCDEGYCNYYCFDSGLSSSPETISNGSGKNEPTDSSYACPHDESILETYKKCPDPEFQEWKSGKHFCVCEFGATEFCHDPDQFFEILYSCDESDDCSGCSGPEEPSCKKNGDTWICDFGNGHITCGDCYFKLYEAEKEGCQEWFECCIDCDFSKII